MLETQDKIHDSRHSYKGVSMAALKAAVAASTDVVFEATPQAVALKVAAKRSEAVIIIICKSLLFSVCVAVQQLVVVGTSQGGEGLQDQVRRSVGRKEEREQQQRR